MVENRSKLDVGNSVSPYAIAAAVAALVALVFGYYLYRSLSSETVYGEIVIATGPERPPHPSKRIIPAPLCAPASKY